LKKALIVSYFFPPRFSIGGKRAFRFARYLPENGWSTTILTAKAPTTERLDPSFGDDDLHSCSIHRDYLTERELLALSKKPLGSDGTVSAPTKMWNAHPARFSGRWWATELRFAPVIGPKVLAIPALARRIEALARREQVDLIYATGSPWEAVVAATLAADSAKRPVIVDFRDPWSFGPNASHLPTWVRVADEKIEAAVLRCAALLTVTTETTRDKYAALGHAQRVECIRNGYDPASNIIPTPAEAFTMVHFGNCYGRRSLGPFLRATARMIQGGQIDRTNIRILNLGRVSEEDLALAKECGIADLFEFRTVLPYDEGLAIVAGAHLALVPAFGDDPWFIPGKFYDYVAVRTPILAISTSPELDGLVERSGLGWVHSANDIDGLARRIATAWEARTRRQTLVEPDESVIESLSVRNGAKKLAKIFDEVTRG
jgi:Glycosyl transferase 4-like domain